MNPTDINPTCPAQDHTCVNVPDADLPEIITDSQDLGDLEKNGQFRVSIFGSARMQPGDTFYQMTYHLAKALGEREIGVVSGGGPGIMEAANKGHYDGDTTHTTNSIGLTVRLPFEKEHNNYLDREKYFEKFSGRLDQFMRLSNAVVVMPGGIGTCLELFYTWQLIQVKHICPIPVIVIGKMWRHLLDWIKEDLRDRYKTISPGDLDMVHYAPDIEDAIKIIEDVKTLYDEADGDVCLNHVIYK